MNINPELLNKIEDLGLNKEQVLLNHFKIMFDLGYTLPEKRTVESANFYTKNYSTGKVLVKNHLFLDNDIELPKEDIFDKAEKESTKNMYIKFIDDLIEKGLSSKGNPDKPVSYTAISKVKGINATLVKLMKTNEYDVILNTTYKYYMNTDHPKTILNYVKEVLEIDLKENNRNGYDIIL